MKILYIYRNINAGPSIRRVFEPIAEEIGKENVVKSICLPHEGASFLSIWKNIKFIQDHLKVSSYDIVHVTGDVYYLLWGLRKYNAVVTVHDLLFYTRINSKLKRKLMYYLELYPLRFAAAVTFISDASKDEALNILSLQKSATSVIYNPVNPSFKPLKKEINKDCPTILHLGTKPNKNLYRVLEALKGIKCKLHIVGKVSKEIIKLINDYNIAAILDSNLSDEQILQAYKDCDIVSFPSLYEGFGMPIIEGQMIGRAVVTSDIAPMNKISGGAAILVNPDSVESIRNGFLSAMDYNESIIGKGISNALNYSVSAISQCYYDIYNKTLLS